MSIVVEGISHSYGGHKVLHDVSFVVPAGTRCALLGPNGAGKTTLVSILCTLIRPQTGTARLDGVDVHRSSAARARIGVVFQGSSLDDRLTVWENLDFHGLVYGMPGRERAAAIAAALDLLDMREAAELPVRQLSGGMRRRLEIGRALMHRPRILFLDEPSVGLDPQTRANIAGHVRGLAGEGVTVLTTTHYIDEVEDYDLVCIIDHGRILAVGTPDALKAAHAQPALEVRPGDAATAEALLRRFPDAVAAGDEVLVPLPSPESEAELLAAFGPRLSAFRRIPPSLEGVFLTLTGRALREENAPVRMKGLRAW